MKYIKEKGYRSEDGAAYQGRALKSYFCWSE